MEKYRVAGWRRWWDLRSPRVAADEPSSPYRGGEECSVCGLTKRSETLFAEYARICSACVRLDVVVENER